MSIRKQGIQSAILIDVERRVKATEEDVIKDLVWEFDPNSISETLPIMVNQGSLNFDGQYYSINMEDIDPNSFDIGEIFKGKENIK